MKNYNVEFKQNSKFDLVDKNSALNLIETVFFILAFGFIFVAFIVGAFSIFKSIF